MIIEQNRIFFLRTDNTEYVLRITDGGYPEHIYYGQYLGDDTIAPLADRLDLVAGNTIAIQDGARQIGMEHFKSELSTRGKGDVREVSIELLAGDGSATSDFVYESHKIVQGAYTLDGLPTAYTRENGGCDSLYLEFKDKNSGLKLTLLYGVFETTDVITRSAVLTNTGADTVTIQKFMSCQLDLDEFLNYEYIGFNGQWINEMNMVRRKLLPGIMGNASFCGNSSNRVNPFAMICEEGAGEDHGEVYGFNLLYSGNHYESTYMDVHGKIRFLQGINPSGFSWNLEAGASFAAPQAIMTYSPSGFAKLSSSFHHFIRDHVTRGEWQYKDRPVLINSWESFYFDINEKNLLGLAKTAAGMGIELFVIDDGWFLGRNDDTSSLGDWEVDEKKFPHGMGAFAEKIKGLNMDLGIWVEPEMVNENSRLFREHPEYAVRIPGKEHATGRNQMILNLTMEEVQDYIIRSMTAVFESADIQYVKWDMNRVFSDSFGSNLSKNDQLSFSHRYILGLYRILDVLTTRFPKILFESCSAGGNRFDPGMLAYMPQTWASDNTDARCRVDIQYSYSFGYPSSCISAHVSQCPNHQTFRNTLLETRFDVAAFGVLGYECNFSDFTAFEKEQMKLQIDFYKKHRHALQYGEFHRLRHTDHEIQWMVYDENSEKALAMYYKKNVIPGVAYDKLFLKGLNDEAVYTFSNRPISFSIKEFGSLINTISPVHIKMNSILHDVVDHFKHIDSETESITAKGRTFNRAGVKLAEGFACRGYGSNMRYMPDNGTRMYLLEKQES